VEDWEERGALVFFFFRFSVIFSLCLRSIFQFLFKFQQMC
jgi:hypothetical protein